MTTDVFRYRLADHVPPEEAESTLVLSILAVEALHGEAQTRLDAGHAFDAKLRTVVIDATTAVGRDFNRLFLGFLSREFGPGRSGSSACRRRRSPPPPDRLTHH